MLPTLAALVLIADIADPAAIRVKVVNADTRLIERAYASPSNAPTWGKDLLQGRRLKTGQTIMLDLKDGCGTYDIRFVAVGGVEYIDDGVALCDGDDVVTLHRGALKKSKQAEKN